MPEIVLEITNEAPMVLELEGGEALMLELLPGVGPRGASGAELAAAIGDDADFAGTMTAALSNRVRVDAAQSLTAPQQAQARDNIGAVAAEDIGDTDLDLVAVFNSGLI